MKCFRIRPGTHFNWLYVVFDKDALWESYLGESEIGDSWEVEIINMTEEEYENLPEFEGF